MVQTKRIEPALDTEVKDLNPRPELVSVPLQAITLSGPTLQMSKNMVFIAELPDHMHIAEHYAQDLLAIATEQLRSRQECTRTLAHWLTLTLTPRLVQSSLRPRRSV